MSREAWIKVMREQMPFASNRVSSLADAQVNVAAIHRAAYDQLMAAADEARERRRGGLGVLLWGDPGVGKSHLLARFSEAIQREDRGVFLLVHNLLAAPRLLASSLLKCFVAKVTAGGVDEPWRSILYGWLYRQMWQAIPSPRGRKPDTISTKEARRLFLSHIEQVIQAELPEQLRPDCRRVCEVLFTYFIATYRLNHRQTEREQRPFLRSVLALTIRALNGEELEAEEWQTLNMTPTETAAHEAFEPDDQRLETVFLVLLEIARRAGSLVVMCFDQVENLSEERFVELFRFNHALLDHGRNLLIITSGVRSDLVTLREQRLAPEAAWDRLAGDTIDLYFIHLQEARELLLARMATVHEAGRDEPDVAARMHDDPLFPLGSNWWRTRVEGLIEVRPRDVISWAHQRWREQCRALAADWEAATSAIDAAGRASAPIPPLSPADRERYVDERVTYKVNEKIQQLRDDPSSLPPDAGRLVGLLKAALQRCRSAYRWEASEPATKRGVRPAYDVVVGVNAGNERRTIGIAVLVTAHATSAAAVYRRLLQDSSPPTLVLVVRDRRVDVTLGEAGERYRAELVERGSARFHDHMVDIDELASLSALEAVLGDSRSGDLEVEIPGLGLQRVTESEVERSHHRCGRYEASPLIRWLVDALTGTAAPRDRSAPRDAPSASGTSSSDEQSTPCDGDDETGASDERSAGRGLSLRACILGELQLVPGIAARDLAERLHDRFARERAMPLDEFTRLVRDEAQRLHQERRLQATPTADDLYLLLRP